MNLADQYSSQATAPPTVIESGSGVEDSSYLIFIDSSRVAHAKNGTTGSIDFSSSNYSYVIQAALDSLTAGRTWKEKVTLRGNFTLNYTISIPAYTVFDFRDSKLTAGDNIIDYDDAISGVEVLKTAGDYIDIYGGSIDGNGKDVHGIRIFNSKVSVYSPTIYNCGYCNIVVWAAGNDIESVLIRDATVYDTISVHWPPIATSTDGTHHVSGVDIVNPRTLGTTNETSILVEGDSRRVTITNPYIRDSAIEGIFIDNIVYGQPTDVKVIGGNILNSSGSGITDEGVNSLFYGVNIEGSKYDGFYINSESVNPNIVSCTARNNGNATVWGRRNGVFINAAKNATVALSHFWDTQSSKTQEYGIRVVDGTENARLLDNDLAGNAAGGVWYGSGLVNPKIINNVGYVTENSGNATVSNNFWVAHNLAFEPSYVMLTATDNATVWVNNKNATHFQVGVSSGSVGINWKAEIR